MNIVNFIDDWNDENSYSPNVDIFYQSSNLASDNIDAILYYHYSNYAGQNGNIFWSNTNNNNLEYPKRAIIGGKEMLWSGFNTPQTLAKKLNNYTRNESDAQCYSVIPVHVWSMNMTSVQTTIDLLDDHVKVVSIDHLVHLVYQNLY